MEQLERTRIKLAAEAAAAAAQDTGTPSGSLRGSGQRINGSQRQLQAGSLWQGPFRSLLSDAARGLGPVHPHRQGVCTPRRKERDLFDPFHLTSPETTGQLVP